MGLLNNINSISSKVGGSLGNISSKINGLMSIAKGILCLPTMVAGFISNIPNMINGIASGVTNTLIGSLTNISGQAAGMVEGAIRSKLNKVNGIVSSISGLVGGILGFVQDVKNQVDDILNFIPSKENCNFSGAALSKCLVQQSLQGVDRKDIRDAAAGLVDVNSLVNKSLTNIGDPRNIIAGYTNKHISQLQRAHSIINKAGKFI